MNRRTIGASLMLAGVFAFAAAPTMASAGEHHQPKPETHKVFVCKYVGKPGVDERLKGGKNPISVDSSATVGTWFNDAQGRSYVLAVDENGKQDDDKYTRADCPVVGPSESPSPTPTVTVTAPGPTVTVTAPGPTVTVTAPGPTVTETVPGPTVTETKNVEVPGPTVTATVTVTAEPTATPTVTETETVYPDPSISVVTETATTTATATATETVTASGQPVPGPTVTVTLDPSGNPVATSTPAEIGGGTPVTTLPKTGGSALTPIAFLMGLALMVAGSILAFAGRAGKRQA